MGIFCEINIAKAGNGEFRAGDVVSGSIKYAVDVNTVFKNITVSLKGVGNLYIRDTQNNKSSDYFNKEEYVDIDSIIEHEEVLLPTGQYETQFSFALPENIPPSFAYRSNEYDYYIKCKISYYIRIKFDRPGMLQLPVRFKKVIAVRTDLIPTLPRDPIIYAKQKKVIKLFAANKIMSVKANIENSVINGGETVRFNYEIFNDINVEITGVEVKLVEVHKFKASGLYDVKRYKNIGAQHRTAGIKGGDTQKADFAITIPFDLRTLQYSNIAFRDYFVKIKVLLPSFRRNFALHIPIEVGDKNGEAGVHSKSPPSYWEVMGECIKDKAFNDNSWSTDEDM
ncbi:uncharacterized protein LOC113515308 [Galleria mellonella]|uniref:Uncharacterized protein LOC113515308 n=1 Tax=Galleria mellonella TaxID=7137 RepID=A0A6J1WSC8_GALME|nr:uncharacterized protein LOC113515308 [Galleria mellonella]